jgi:corrinoid protein of di/trimethylamine methyltransferase
LTRKEVLEMSREILDNLKKSLRAYDQGAIAGWAGKVLEAGLDPLEAINALTGVMQEIGEEFNREELFLPDLIASGATMEAAMAVLNPELIRRGQSRESLGTVVLGTVFGDIHSIGKDMVRSLLTAAGFSVQDLGIDVKAEAFIAAVKERRPHILAMSALLTTTAQEQKVVIEALQEAGLRDKVKVMVGGGGINEQFARSIGADVYGATATEAVSLAKGLMGR